MENKENILSNAQLEDDFSLNLIACRELIELVRSNELLWKKRCVSHKDQQMKNLSWTSIGNSLTSKLSGKLYENSKIGMKIKLLQFLS